MISEWIEGTQTRAVGYDGAGSVCESCSFCFGITGENALSSMAWGHSGQATTLDSRRSNSAPLTILVALRNWAVTAQGPLPASDARPHRRDQPQSVRVASSGGILRGNSGATAPGRSR